MKYFHKTTTRRMLFAEIERIEYNTGSVRGSKMYRRTFTKRTSLKKSEPLLYARRKILFCGFVSVKKRAKL